MASYTDKQRQFIADFPVYALVYHERSGLVIVAGGGGPSKSGIKNGFVLLKLKKESNSFRITALSSASSSNSNSAATTEPSFLSTGEEAVMSLSLHDDGADCILMAGVNDRCWLLEVATGLPGTSSLPKLSLLKTVQSDCSATDDGYLRVTRFAPSGRFCLAAGSDGCCRQWGIPEMRLQQKFEAANLPSEVTDCDTLEATANVPNCLTAIIYSSQATQVQIYRESKSARVILADASNYSFKFARFIQGTTKGTAGAAVLLLTVQNWKAAVSGGPKRRPHFKGPIISLWALDLDGTASGLGVSKPLHSLTLSPSFKNCTCVSIAVDRAAFGFADGSLLVLNLKDQMKSFSLHHPAAHPFPVTGLALDPERSLLISSSADGVILCNPLEKTLKSSSKIASASSSLRIFSQILIFLLAVGGLLLAWCWQANPQLFHAILGGIGAGNQGDPEDGDDLAIFDAFYKVLNNNDR